MDKQAFMQLVETVVDGSATEQELSLYNNYINHFNGDGNWNEKTMGNEADTKTELFDLINQETETKIIPFYNRNLFGYLAACVALIVVAMGVIFYNNNLKVSNDKNKTVLKNDVSPGGNEAILVLADGSEIILNDTDQGKITEQSGVSISKTKDGQLIYRISGPVQAKTQRNEAEITYNTISTPRGGQYQVLLSDGTRVWLNASSSLKFPTSFAGTQRNVELIGQAYFEVAKNESKPFVVQADEMKVLVLGTHFDVMAYPDEKAKYTTLIEGAVSVLNDKEAKVLIPGQQAIVDQDIQVKKAGDEMVAWKNGLTSFKDADIRTIMRQVARWYDIEVNYEGEIPTRLFTGEISRKANLSEFIKVIELSNIKLKLEGKVITVMP